MLDTLNNFKVRRNAFYQAMLLEVGRELERFNEASNNTIRLIFDPLEGNYEDDIMRNRINGLINDRDVTSQASVAETNLEHVEQTRVKYARRAGPVDLNEKTFDYLLQDPAQAAAWIAQQFSQDMPMEMFDRAVKALVAAMAQNTNFVYDGTGDSTTTITRDKFVKGDALLGDQYRNVSAFIMHSTPFHNLRESDLLNSERLFVFNDLSVFRDTLGRPLLVIDSPALVTPGSPDTYHILGLTPGAVEVSENGDFTDNIERKNGEQNIKGTWQAQWTENLKIAGHSWDSQNGGSNPTEASITTASNWDKITGHDLKNGPGFIIDVTGN